MTAGYQQGDSGWHLLAKCRWCRGEGLSDAFCHYSPGCIARLHSSDSGVSFPSISIAQGQMSTSSWFWAEEAFLTILKLEMLLHSILQAVLAYFVVH